MNNCNFYKIENFTDEGYGEIKEKNKKYLVKNSIKGEIVELNITKTRRIQITESIKEYSEKRQNPVCKHFLLCGNCQLQHLDNDSYKEFKVNLLKKYLIKAGYLTYPKINFVPGSQFSRRKASFIVNYTSMPVSIGFFQEFSNKVIDLEECFIVTKKIFSIIKIIKKDLLKLLKEYKISRIIVTEIDDLLDIIFENNIFFDVKAHKILRNFLEDNNISRITSNFTNIINIIAQKDNVEKLGQDYKVNLPANYFIQATQKMEDILIEIIPKWVKEGGKIIDLYSGFGFLSMKLAQIASVECYEISYSMINVIKEASFLYQRKYPLICFQRDLEANPVKSNYMSKFDYVIINPPRKGFYKQVKEIAESNCKNIILISCDVVNFSRDCHYLKKANYEIKDIIIIDQFLYSSHLEFVLLLTKF